MNRYDATRAGVGAAGSVGGVQGLRRDGGDPTEFVIVTVGDSRQAITALAGDDIERAVYHPEDERYLVEHDDLVTPDEVTTSD